MPPWSDPVARFYQKYAPIPCKEPGIEGPCWQWLDAPNGGGYGTLSVNGTKELAHRFAWELYRGPIPDGDEIDHRCRNRGCVNPDHLEPVPPWLNVRRGNGPLVAGTWQRRTTHCPRGHPYDLGNTYVNPVGSRDCRACSRIEAKHYRLEAKGREEKLGDADIERFWSRVDRSDLESCWLWPGALDRNGHGEFTFRGKKISTHKLVYLLAYGPIKKGKHVRLTCGNNRCVNPAHLRAPSRNQEVPA